LKFQEGGKFLEMFRDDQPLNKDLFDRVR